MTKKEIFAKLQTEITIRGLSPGTFYIAPFIGVRLSFIIFREIPGLMFFIALIIMALGTWLINREQKA